MSTVANRNLFWAGLAVEEFIRLGCDTFFVSPGLRSSPFVAAVARNSRAHAHVHFDERGSAFAALGHARATLRPAVWITTSGTALANGFPAVIEAALDAVPLILLTADRPPEQRESGANQTIRQAGIFGDYVRWFFDMPAPSPEIDPAFVLTTIDQAVYRAVSGRGPVHLNAMFREPLVPEPLAAASEPDDSTEVATGRKTIARWRQSDAPYTAYAQSDRFAPDDALRRLSSASRPVCILGRLGNPAMATDVLQWASERRIPIFPDILSGARLGPDGPPLVPYFDLVLSDSASSRDLPDAVIQVGRTPVSKRLQAYLAAAAPECFTVVADGPERIDPGHLVTDRLEVGAAGLSHLFRRAEAGPVPENGWLERWTARGARAAEQVQSLLEPGGECAWSEQAIARRLSELLPAEQVLVLGSSLPVRHMDSFGRADRERVFVIANRGASGIDGTVATAAGAALSVRRPVTLFLGDQALLHDLNSLNLLARTATIVVVLNNGGGGIFSLLPIRAHADIFDRYFAAAHDFTFRHAAELFGIGYERPVNQDAFAEAYQIALASERATLIEIVVEMASTREANASLLAAVRDLPLE